ncbi:type IV pilus assembly protein PilM [Candidatus Hydrogenedentota bacterium]
MAKFKKAISVDVGTFAVKALQISKSGDSFQIEKSSLAQINQDDYAQDPELAQTSATAAALEGFATKNTFMIGALPGQSVVIRYPRLPQMPEDELQAAIETEAGQSIPYDLEEVTLDSLVLDTVAEGGENLQRVLLVAAKNEVIESRMRIFDDSGIEPYVFSVDSLAVADAAEFERQFEGVHSVALVNLGANTTNIHFCKDGISNFIRDISWGGQELTTAIQRALRVVYEEAEQMKKDFAEADIAPPDEAPAASPALEPDGGAGAATLEEAVQPIIARLVGEVRRSFEYYEQQLYESPVEKVILTGGVAAFPLVAHSFIQSLGIDNVVVASPATGFTLSGEAAAVFNENPAQFAVAVGLAVRGTQEL